MEQPKIPLPPHTWADYLNGRDACLRHMSPEGRARAASFWKTRPIPEPQVIKKPRS